MHVCKPDTDYTIRDYLWYDAKKFIDKGYEMLNDNAEYGEVSSYQKG